MRLAHQQAWSKVKSQVFGSVCEVARRTPWGFKCDDDSIDNKTVKEYLGSKDFFDTVILHILSGEGESQSQIIDVLNHAYANSVKILVLEHNPYHEDWNDLSKEMISSKPRDIDFIRKWIDSKKEKFDESIIGDGRNLLISFTTMQPLHLPQLSDDYLKENIDKKYVNSHDCGIDKKFRVYTHTSEYGIDFDLPEGRIYWTIGGGLPYEAMSSSNENILFDSVLLQVLYSGYLYGVDKNKLKRIFKDIEKIGEGSPDTLPHWNNRPNLWRKTKSNGVVPDSIIHKNIKDLNCENDTVYVSSIDKNFWGHLESKNNVIDSWTKRDFPTLYLNESSLIKRLTDLESLYGGVTPPLKRRKVSDFDPRTKKQLESGGMRGGDRMSSGRLSHGYAPIYAKYMSKILQCNSDDLVVEVGILKGSGIAILSNLFPNNTILGFDIDLSYAKENMPFLLSKGAFAKNQLFLHEYDQFLDNTDYLKEVLKGKKIKLLVDDGFHSDESILMTLKSFKEYLSKDFVYFIEDNNTAYKKIIKLYPWIEVFYKNDLTVLTPK